MADKLLETMAVRIPIDEHEALRRVADADGVSVFELVRSLIESHMAMKRRQYEALHQAFAGSTDSARNGALRD